MDNEIKEIQCNVSNCAFNKDNCKCTAGHIEVGTKNATTKEETRCKTFTPCSSCDNCNF